MNKRRPPSKTAFERQIEESPDMGDVRYQEYVRKGGRRWGYGFRINYPDDFNKQYTQLLKKWNHEHGCG